MTDPTRTTSGTLPLGPFDLRPEGQLRAALGDAGAFVVPDWRERRAQWLRLMLENAGVELWGYDLATVDWVATWEPESLHVLGGWIARAAAGAHP